MAGVVDLREARHKLPGELTSFVGRRPELDELQGLLGAARLVTLTGPGGVGKTRLALAAARERLDAYADGCWLVSLAPIGDSGLVPQVAASALGVAEQPGTSMVEAMVDHLKDRRLLVVMDSCEHLVEACSGLVEYLLRSCPCLSVLATSQEALALPGEVVYRVPPLAMPAAEAAASLPVVAASDAAHLFLDRARAARPGLVVGVEDASALARICCQLDGIPLALELAAACTSVLSIEQIASRLDDRFELLLRGHRGALPRHRTLQAAVDWSYDLLRPRERLLLHRLSVFVGGWTLEAAEQVCASDDLPRREILRLLGNLVGKSLVNADLRASQARYGMLETVRQYAGDKLRQGASARQVRSAHLCWAVGLAERAEPELMGPGQRVWLDALDVERDNLRAALAWATEDGQLEDGLRLAGSLSLYWHIRGSFREGCRWLQAVLDLPGEAPPGLRGAATWGLGFLLGYSGDRARAGQLVEASLDLARVAGDAGGIARSLSLIGDLSLLRDPVAARSLLGKAVTAAREAGDDWCVADSLGKLGWSYLYQGRAAEAGPFFGECLALAEGRDLRNARRGHGGMGWAALFQGHLGEAADHLAKSLRLARELGDATWIAQSLNALGELARIRGDLDQARGRLDEALALGRAIGSPFTTSLTVGLMGRVAYALGDADRALRLFEEALAESTSAGVESFVVWWLAGRADALAAGGDVEAALASLKKGLALARAGAHDSNTAACLDRLGRLARRRGDEATAALHAGEALRLRVAAREAGAVPDSLESLAGLATMQESPQRSARLLAAAQALRETGPYARGAIENNSCDGDLARARASLGAAFDAAWAEGYAMGAEEAVDYALRPTPGRHRGLDAAAMTPTERSVARLAAEGLTNAEIGARLFVSPRTVQTHLAHIFAKLGVASRRDLRRELARRGP